jgi:hypothetical protein
MSSSHNEIEKLSAVVSEIGEKLTEEYHCKCCKLFDEMGLFELGNENPVPLEIWIGVAQSLADASGYRVVLQAMITEPLEKDDKTYRIVGQREVANADPMLFVK